MRIEVFSSKFVTKKNKNGRGIIDIDTPEGIEIFGGKVAVDEYKKELEIANEMYRIAKESVESKG